METRLEGVASGESLEESETDQRGLPVAIPQSLAEHQGHSVQTHDSLAEQLGQPNIDSIAEQQGQPLKIPDSLAVQVVPTPPNSDLLPDIATQYASFVDIGCSKEMDQFTDTIDDLLTKLDEFLGFADLIRGDVNLALGSTLGSIHTKTEAMKKNFERIDKLEVFVAMVKANLTGLEASVDQAEIDLGTINPLKKVFNSFTLPTLFGPKPVPKTNASNPVKPTLRPIRTFRTADYFLPTTNDVSSNSGSLHSPPGAVRSFTEGGASGASSAQQSAESCVSTDDIIPAPRIPGSSVEGLAKPLQVSVVTESATGLRTETESNKIDQLTTSEQTDGSSELKLDHCSELTLNQRPDESEAEERRSNESQLVDQTTSESQGVETITSQSVKAEQSISQSNEAEFMHSKQTVE